MIYTFNYIYFYFKLPKVPNEEFNLINKNMDELSKKIWSLSKEEYSNVKFDNLVTEIRNYASEVCS